MAKTSEEAIQFNTFTEPNKIGKYNYYQSQHISIKQYMDAGIIPKKNYDDPNKKTDGLIIKHNRILAVVEYKAVEKFNTKAKQTKAFNQAKGYALDLGAKIIICTDGSKTNWYNAETNEVILNETGDRLTTVFSLTSSRTEEMAKLIELLDETISKINSQIKPIEYRDPTALAGSVWQQIYAPTKASPENCLYTFVELFIFKYLSDLGVLTGMHSFDYLYGLYGQKSISDEDVLRNYVSNVGAREQIKHRFPVGKDGTTIINGTMFVNDKNEPLNDGAVIFKEILKKFNKYGELKNIDRDFKSKLFEYFLKNEKDKKKMGQFFTPLKVVKQMVEMVEITENMKICDPASGVGKFLLEGVVPNLRNLYNIDSKGKLKRKIELFGFDKGFEDHSERTVILAKANMMIYFSELIKDNPDKTEEFAKLFNDTFHLKNSNLGTLRDTVYDEFDLILTNPPYLVSGTKILKDSADKTYYSHNGTGLEGLFMEWIVNALKKGGTALVVIPDGLMTRSSDTELRKFILEKCIINGIISLPLNTFFSTSKKTFILSITKKQNTDMQSDAVFTYFANSTGETLDTYRFETDDDDLKEAVYQYNTFKHNKNEYTKRFNDGKFNDGKCKIVPIQHFYDNVEHDWFIDNLWTEEEKIELGLKEEKETMTVSELQNFIDDVIGNLNDYKEVLDCLS